MHPTDILYLSKHGQTARIANAVATRLRSHGVTTSLVDLERTRAPQLGAGSDVVVIAPLYLGRFPRTFRRFLSTQRSALEARAVNLITVSLTQATFEVPGHTDEDLDEARRDLAQCVSELCSETSLRPARVFHAAGSLMYTRYNPVIRWIMTRIAREQGASIDTTRDHEFTNWRELDGFVDALVAEAHEEPVAATG